MLEQLPTNPTMLQALRSTPDPDPDPNPDPNPNPNPDPDPNPHPHPDQVLELLYPEGGYSAETGGKLANLRRLTNAQVRRYHAENYRPDNTAFIVSGMVSEAASLAALSQVDAALGSG